MMKTNRFEIKQIGELNILEIYLYGDIEGDYYDFWTGKLIESTTSAKHIQNVIATAGQYDGINVYINSMGGSVYEGVAINNILKRSNVPVYVYIDAFAYSIASVIAMAGTKVFMPSNATMMIHNAIMGCYGNSAELRKAADDLDVINEASCNSYLAKSDKLSREELTAMLDAETFLTADKALEYGLIDEIIDPINVEDSLEIVQKAMEKKNPYAKKAFEQIKHIEPKQVNEPPKPPEPEPVTEPEPKEPEQKEEPSIFDWFTENFKI